MSKANVKRFLLGYFIVLFGAVFLRIDYFPLTWVPMYGFRSEGPYVTVGVGDLKRRDVGFAAVRANGERLFVSRTDLNVPPANFRRLYQERAFNEGPPQHRRERHQLIAFNRWWYETLIGEDPAKSANYPRDILRSVNETMGLGPADPRRIVQLEAHMEFATFTHDHLGSGDLSGPARELRTMIITDAGTRMIRKHVAGPPPPASVEATVG